MAFYIIYCQSFRSNDHVSCYQKYFLIPKRKQIFKRQDEIYRNNKSVPAPFTITEMIKNLNTSPFYVTALDTSNHNAEKISLVQYFSREQVLSIRPLRVKSLPYDALEMAARFCRDSLIELGVNEKNNGTAFGGDNIHILVHVRSSKDTNKTLKVEAKRRWFYGRCWLSCPCFT